MTVLADGPVYPQGQRTGRTNDLSDLDQLLDERLEDAREAVKDGQLAEAVSICNEIIRLKRSHEDAWKLRTEMLIAMGRRDLAFDNAREATKLFPTRKVHRLMQARIHVQERRWDKAAATYRAVLRDDPLHLNSIRELMDIEPVTPEDDITARLRAAQDDAKMAPYDRASLWFLQGQIYMTAGRDDEAFALFDEGNRQMRAVHAGKRLEYSFTRLLPEFDTAFQRRHEQMVAPDPCPLLLIVGLPRSGKSLLERLLASQPSLVAGGETSHLYKLFLGVDRTQGADVAMRELMRRPVSPIRRYFDALLRNGPKPAAQRVIDTTPGNLEQLAFLGPMHPDVPIVFVRRQTRDLATALYFKQFNNAHRYTFDLAVAARAIARTEHLARRWQDTMPNPSVEVSYEEIVADPVGVSARILQGFGMAVDHAALDHAATDGGRRLNMSPGRSVDGVGAISADLVGFSDRFARHVETVMPNYEAERANLR